MNCEYFRELISAYLDDELTAEEASELSGHLAECRSCSKELEELEDLKRSGSFQTRASMPSQLEKSILEKTSGGRRRFKPIIDFIAGKYAMPKPVVWGACAALLLLAALSIFRSPGIAPQPRVHQTTANAPVRVQKVVMTENDIIETKTSSLNNNL